MSPFDNRQENAYTIVCPLKEQSFGKCVLSNVVWYVFLICIKILFDALTICHRGKVFGRKKV